LQNVKFDIRSKSWRYGNWEEQGTLCARVRVREREREGANEVHSRTPFYSRKTKTKRKKKAFGALNTKNRKSSSLLSLSSTLSPPLSLSLQSPTKSSQGRTIKQKPGKKLNKNST